MTREIVILLRHHNNKPNIHQQYVITSIINSRQNEWPTTTTTTAMKEHRNVLCMPFMAVRSTYYVCSSIFSLLLLLHHFRLFPFCFSNSEKTFDYTFFVSHLCYFVKTLHMQKCMVFTLNVIQSFCAYKAINA